MSQVIHLADGRSVPAAAVKALDDFEAIWPGATFPGARPAIAARVLETQHEAQAALTRITNLHAPVETQWGAEGPRVRRCKSDGMLWPCETEIARVGK